MEKKNLSEYGIRIGMLPCGVRNQITDVPGVRVGHSTIKTEKYNTGCTVILPTEENIYVNKLIAASFVHNGYGKTVGTVQIEELGTLETPIALTNTLNVGQVADAVIEYTIGRCAQDGVQATSVNPVVGECNDSLLNKIIDRPVKKEHVFEAIETASADFEEGNVGAGTGTQCYGFKGGIGSASRVVMLDGKPYTVGILVQSNYGETEYLRINGNAPDLQVIKEVNGPECDKGSIIVVLACDIPMTARQLKRVIRRCSVGIARLGSYIGHGSGEVFLGFSTANVLSQKSDIFSIQCINERAINPIFRAVCEATEEAILHSMLCASSARKQNGDPIYSLSNYIDRIVK